ncbi:MAG: RNA polymerase sporulation sigma factor SigH [Oscillospiraceae bacterium]|nr:RNA polymerase sporulation sigma factor SigH [Oscillospiraceae bacterium]
MRNGNKDALDYLICKYKNFVNLKVSKYFIIGAEKDDIIQEGLIGLYKAIQDYDASKQSSFKSFANLCIERHLITVIKTSNRQKHIPLNSSVSLNNSIDNNEDNSMFIDILNSQSVEDPLDTITKKEFYQSVETKINNELSSFEKKVLYNYINGQTYVDIAAKLKMPVKSIDNAIQRIRKKTNKNNFNDYST